MLDTDHVSLFLGKHPIVVNKINSIDAQKTVTTIATVQEVVEGDKKCPYKPLQSLILEPK